MILAAIITTCLSWFSSCLTSLVDDMSVLGTDILVTLEFALLLASAMFLDTIARDYRMVSQYHGILCDARKPPIFVLDDCKEDARESYLAKPTLDCLVISYIIHPHYHNHTGLWGY
jgi:hypothetical protein